VEEYPCTWVRRRRGDAGCRIHLRTQGGTCPTCQILDLVPSHSQPILAFPPCSMCGTQAVAGNHEPLAPVLGRARDDVLAPSGRRASEPEDDGGVDATACMRAVGCGVDENLAGAEVATFDKVAGMSSHC